MRHKRYQTKRCIEEGAFYRNCAGRFVHLLLCFAFSQGFHSTKEIPDGSRKIAEDGKYYVMVGEQRIRLSEDRFQRMESGKSYSINYMWSRYYKEWTYVVYIEDETGNRF